MGDDLDLLNHPGRCSEHFQSLVERWGKQLHSLALRLLGDREEARDVRQLAFLKLWDALAEMPPERAGAWLHRVVVNLCRDRLRARRTRTRFESGAAAPDECQAPSVLQESARREVADHVARAVADLPEKEREVLVLKHYGELPFRDVAAALEIPVTTAKSRMARALDRLRLQLRDMDAS